MFELSTVLFVGIASLVGGIIVGALIVRSLSPQEQQNRQMETRLQEAEEKFRNYQHEVTEHFSETSKMVNKLTQDYKEVHEFLAKSALKLTNHDISRQLIEAGEGKLLSDEDAAINQESVSPPRDWAPKTPGQQGQLSEGFGLKEEDEPKIPARP